MIAKNATRIVPKWIAPWSIELPSPGPSPPWAFHRGDGMLQECPRARAPVGPKHGESS
jgi:hypothetical protein